ncbi:MAG: TrkA family potassium uptake protein [Lentisphaeria bacterium]|nr:TrkA family potassium uptake protein [Lentisphaeria bacterium]
MDLQIAVIGMGIFGREVALSLARRGFGVMVVDHDSDEIEPVKDHVAQAVILDTTDERALLDAKIDEMGVVVVAIGNQHVENSIMTTALVRQIGVPRIIARATSDLHARILRQVGATEVVNPEQDLGRRIASQIARPGLREVLQLAGNVCVAEVPVPASFVGKTIMEIDVRKKYGVNVVGVQRLSDKRGSRASSEKEPEDGESLLKPNRQIILDVSASCGHFRDDDILIVAGQTQDVDRLSGLG